MRCTTPPPGCRGFSLLELLVVVSIVALLAALLVPAIASVRSSAQTLRCAAILGQFGLANATYAADHRGRLVPLYQTGTTNYGTAAQPQYGSAWMHQWIDNRDFLERIDPAIQPGHVTATTRCPASWQGTTAINRNFGINRSAPGYAPDGGWNNSVGDDLYRQARTLIAPTTSRVVAGSLIFTDAVDWLVRDWNFASWTMASEVTGSWQANSYRHRQRGNGIRADGSLVVLLKGSPAVDRNTPEGGLLWLGRQ